jgi:maltooligosyltrehalose trehalohydrolase
MQRVHAMPFGAEVTEAGVRFALYAPSASDVTLLLDGAERAIPDVGGGWRRLVEREAHAGSRYAFRIDGRLDVPDPASRFQPEDVHRPSAVIDPRAYAWRDTAWTGRAWEETVLYEVHVGTVTREGTFTALTGKLNELKELGVTAIELMPLADFAGRRNWGYDGVLPFAPDATYGTPDDLKRLVDTAHGLGLMVFIDVVYNHFGPSGNYLDAYAKPFFTERHHTPWGAAINFDGNDAGPVREFFIHNALYWLEEYHVDGLRFDAVHAILDDSEPHILAEIAERVRAALPGREIHLVLENDANEARWLKRDGCGRPTLHTAQWSDDIHHCWHVLLTGEQEGYYEDYADAPERLARSLAEGFAYQGEPSHHRGGEPRGETSAHLPPSAFVAFLQNHDQVGNRACGDRLSRLTPPERLALARALLLLSPQIPLLFMGEEWNAAAPFLYFVDFADDTALSDAVRNGRRQEFQRFKAFADPQAASRIPDPTAVDTYMSSVLCLDEGGNGSSHRQARDEAARLLRLRMAEIVPLTRSRYRGAEHLARGDGLLRVTWRYEAGSLSLIANLGAEPIGLDRLPPGRMIWASPNAADANIITLAPWSGCIVKDATQ